jgi:hypothetical protein
MHCERWIRQLHDCGGDPAAAEAACSPFMIHTNTPINSQWVYNSTWTVINYKTHWDPLAVHCSLLKLSPDIVSLPTEGLATAASQADVAAGDAGAEGEQQNATTARSSTDGAAGAGAAAPAPKDLLVGHRSVGVQWSACIGLSGENTSPSGPAQQQQCGSAGGTGTPLA